MRLFALALLFTLCLLSNAASAQTSSTRTRLFPPDGCVPGQTNLIAWNGPGTSTRCLQLPICTGADVRLQYDGDNFQCASGQPPCLGADCLPPAGDACPPQDAAWEVGIHTCGATLPLGANGEVVTVQSNHPANSTGTAQYRCRAPSPVCTGTECPPPPPGQWELLDGATCERTACPGPGCPDIRPQASMESSSGSVAPQR